METEEQATCPRCGRPGRERVYEVRAGGRVYAYRMFIHYEAGRVIRCIAGRADGAPLRSRQRRPRRAVEAEAARGAVVPTGALDEAAAWHIVKAAASWGSLRENPTDSNLARFREALATLASRRNVNVDAALEAAEAYVATGSPRAKQAVNEALVEMALSLAKAAPQAERAEPKVQTKAEPRGPLAKALRWLLARMGPRLGIEVAG
jgi:hypothetical protein